MNIEHTIRRYIRLNQKLLVYILLVCISIIGGLIGIIPGAKRIVGLLEENKALEQEVTALTDKVSFLNAYDVTYLENLSEGVLAAVPGDKSIATFLGTVENTAQKHALLVMGESLDNIGAIASSSATKKPVGKSTLGNVMPLTMVVGVQGELSHIRDFLEEIIRVRRLVTVSHLDLSFSGKTYTPEAKVTIEGYYIPLPQTLGKTTDKMQDFSAKESEILEKTLSYPIVYQIASVSAVTTEPTTPVAADPFNPKGN